MTIPEWAILLYPMIMIFAVWTGLWLKSRQPPNPQVNSLNSWWLGLAAFVGAMLGAKLPGLLFDHSGETTTEILAGSKTILFGLPGGYFAVELAKWRLRLRTRTGDSFVVPVAASIAVGRLSCFAGSCCYGTPTDLPWACVFQRVDSLPRHPTQVYEFLFHLSAAGIFSWLKSHGRFQNHLIKLYFITYGVYRFCTEWIRPEVRWQAGLTGYQWGALVLIGVFGMLWYRDL